MMEAGRELDALIARMMGRDLSAGKHDWREIDVDERDFCQSTYFCDRCGTDAGWVAGSELDMSESCKPLYPFYSTDISAAWPLAEKLGLMLIPVTVYPSEDSWEAYKKEEVETWWACVPAYTTIYLPLEAYRDEWGGSVGWVEKEVGLDDVAKIAPHAICLAALKAVQTDH